MDITIKTIAKQAGVSIATVSRAMRPETEQLVKLGTKEKIRRIIARNGYAPNRAAVNLIKRKSGVIGFAIPFFPSHLATNDYFATLTAGVFDFMGQSEYDFRVLIVQQGTFSERDRQVIISRGVDGLLISGWPTFPQFKEFLRIGIPLMVINDYQRHIRAHFVYADNYSGGYQVGRLFARLKYCSCAATTPAPEWFPDMEERLAGYRQALREAHIPFPQRHILPCGVKEEEGYDLIVRLLKRNILPRAIFFMNDTTAIGALRALKDKSIPCPQQAAIVGFDDIRLGTYTEPRLTTVHQPVYELGKQGAQLLVEAIRQEGRPFVRKKFPVELIMRDSCGT